MKVAIVYDRVNKWGGAERVLLTLHEMFPEAPLFTSVYSKKHAPWANVFPDIHLSFLQNIPFAKRNHELFPLFMPLAFESFNFDHYDLVISVTSEAAKGIRTRGKTKHICYCLTPTRYLWSGYKEYFHQNDKLQISNYKPGKGRLMLNKFRHDMLRTLSKPMVNHLKRWDVVAAQRPDVMIAISKAVQDRIAQYYGRTSEVIHPPTEIEKFLSQKSKKQIINIKRQKEYFLVVSRLVPYKKVDLAVEAFNTLGTPLLIVGKGSQERKLKKAAKKNIQFISDITDDELATVYKDAQALIFPQEEDFGLVAVEAHASGIPVISFRKGGAMDIVTHGKTGMFFSEQNVKSLREAITRLSDFKFKKQDLKRSARRFTKEKFKTKLIRIVGKVM
jgi:glycosyltransferase involved in cell wall biosynthesis